MYVGYTIYVTSDVHNVYMLLRYMHVWFNLGMERQFQHVDTWPWELGMGIKTVFKHKYIVSLVV